MKKFKIVLFLLTLITFTVWGLEVKSQETKENQSSNLSQLSQSNFLTTKNPEIPTEELKLLVKPLTKKELQIEAQGWLLLLKSKVQEISDAEIAVKRQSQQIKETQKDIKTIDESENEISEIEQDSQPNSSTEIVEDKLQEIKEEKTEVKKQIVTNVTELQIEKTALVERFNLVLDELELKGGEITDDQQYIQAVTGVEIDLNDADTLGVRILTWLQSEEGGINWFLSILRFVGIISFCLLSGWIVNQLYQATHNKYLANQLDDQIEPIISRVIHLTIWTIVGIVTLSSVGFNVTAVITSLGIGGLAFALAAQDTVANLFGGVTILVQRKIRVGERIEVEGIKARVVEIGLRTTILKELEYDYEIFVPNSKFANNIVSNIDSRPHYSVYEILHLHHTTSSQQIELALELIKAITSKNEFIKGARPSLNKINDYSFDLKFVYWIKKWQPEEKNIFPNDLWKMYTVRSEMNLEIMREFEKNNLKLALPIRLSPKYDEINSTGIFTITNQNSLNLDHKN